MVSSLNKKAGIPHIAIIGRPNVGKSTLFNRLVGSRRSITDSTPGVTRDLVEAACRIRELPCLVVDTGGYTTEKEVFNSQVSARALAMAEQADLILMLVDVNALDSDDYTFIETVRPFSGKLILVINKVDTPEKEDLVWDFYQLGFTEIVALSAAHGRNMDELEEKICHFFKEYAVSPVPEREEDNLIRIAIIGKPNTGKSTLANLLLGEEKSLVSDIPGTTRDVVEGRFLFEGREFQLMDTAGIRRKKKVIDQVEYYSVNRAISTLRQSEVIFLLVDAGEGLAEQDKKIAQLAVERGRGIILVLSKWDRLEDIPNRLQAMTDRIRYLFPLLGFAPVLPLSALTDFGVKRLLKTSFLIRDQLYRRVDTSRLNSKLKEWLDSYPLRDKGKSVRILYATQVSVNPVKFVFFASRKKGVRREYITYLKNRIRSDLGFDKIPFSLEIREHRQTKK